MVADVCHAEDGGASYEFLRIAVPPGVGDHAVGGGKGAGGDGGVAHAGFRGGVGEGSVAEPRTFFDEALQAPGPLKTKLVDIVGAHLVDDQEDHEFRSGGRLGGPCLERWGASGCALCPS